jgi:hypothetical protein
LPSSGGGNDQSIFEEIECGCLDGHVLGVWESEYSDKFIEIRTVGMLDVDILVSNLQSGTQGGRGRVKTRMTKVVCNIS